MNLDELFKMIYDFKKQYGTDPEYISVSPEEYQHLMKLISEMPIYSLQDVDRVIRFYGIPVRIMDGTPGE